MKKSLSVLIIILILFGFVSAISATLNVIVITDPTAQDPNGAAAGSMSFGKNMFMSTFLMSKEHRFVILSGGEGNETPRLSAIVNSISVLDQGATASSGAAVASSFPGIRLMVGGPEIGAAVGGSFDVYLVTVEDDETIKITPYSGGLVVLPPGKKGAIIHLRNTGGNPLYGTATAVRKEAAIDIGRMIRDGYSATAIVGKTFRTVAIESGEKYGGGAVNLVSGVSTGDMFTPQVLNTQGYPMDEEYGKSCPTCGWSIGFPAAEEYNTCPNDGTPLKTFYAYDALTNAITVSPNSVIVSTYGTDAPGIFDTTSAIVKDSVKVYGYNSVDIAGSINKNIKNGNIVGVNYVEPKDINVRAESNAVGVYFNPLPEGRSSPVWDLPINSFVLNVLGSIQTVIGVILIVLLIFRRNLTRSFQRNN